MNLAEFINIANESESRKTAMETKTLGSNSFPVNEKKEAFIKITEAIMEILNAFLKD